MGDKKMSKEEVPSVNPKLDAMCEMLKTIHDLNERNKTLEAQIEKMKCCGNCQTVRDAEGNCYLKKDGKCKNLSEWEIKRK